MSKGYDETSIDLHLDHVREARIWDVEALADSEEARGSKHPEVMIGRFNWAKFAEKHLKDPPEWAENSTEKVLRRGPEIIVRPGSFLLWQTKEKVGRGLREGGDGQQGGADDERCEAERSH